MSRNLNFRTKPFVLYAKALGEAALVWNDFHMVLSSLFGAVTRIPNKIAPDSMWNALKSDRAQREMLEALIDLNAINYNIPIKLKSEMKWVLKIARGIEDTRNDLLHAPVFKESSNNIFAWHHLGNKRAKKLNEKNLVHEARFFYDTVVVLRDYTEVLIVTFNRQRIPGVTLPKRPSLPNRGATKRLP